MSEPTDPFELMRDLIPEATPNRKQAERARNVLQAEIAAESQATSRSQSRNKALARLAVAAVVFAIVAVSVTAFLSRGDTAVATLQEIAQAARAAEATDIPPGGFLFQQSTERSLRIVPGDELGVDQGFVAYVLTSDRSVWRDLAEGFVQIRSVNRDPQFFAPEAERGYIERGLADTDGLNLVITEQFTDVADEILDSQWPETPDQLFAQITEVLGRSGEREVQAYEVFSFAISMLAEPVEPQLRATILELLPLTAPSSITVGEVGSVRIEYEFTDDLAARQTVVIRADGTLQSREVRILERNDELFLPPGVVTSSASYGPWTIASDLN